jgi:ComF family protein
MTPMTPVTPVTPPVPNPKSPIPFPALAHHAIRAAGNGVVSALLAPSCAVCSALLDEPLSGCVCRTCWQSIRPITPPICDRCGDPLTRQNQSPIPNPQSLTQSSQSLCPRCCACEGAVGRARAIGEYEGTLREIIHALKYAGRRSLARPLAERMRERGRDLLLDEVDWVVPVPLHWRREYRRGFNQSREIARHLGPPIVEALSRRRATRAQVELAADARHANVADAFRLRRHWLRERRLQGMRVLLVDDVSTTGATLEACARVLKQAGASEVYALTAARVCHSAATAARSNPRPQSPIPGGVP